MTEHFLDPPVESRSLIQKLSALCAELLRERVIRVQDRVVSSEDLQRHFDALMRYFRLATEQRDRNPSFLSSMVVALMATFIDDRATNFLTRPSPLYQATRAALEAELQKAVSGEPGKMGVVMLRLVLRNRRIEALVRLLSTGEQLTFLGQSPVGGPVFKDEYGEVYRFSALTPPPTHTCNEPSVLSPGQQVTLTTMENDGNIAFMAGCPCNYLATGLELERDL